jgi:hypothetical protein
MNLTKADILAVDAEQFAIRSETEKAGATVPAFSVGGNIGGMMRCFVILPNPFGHSLPIEIQRLSYDRTTVCLHPGSANSWARLF